MYDGTNLQMKNPVFNLVVSSPARRTLRMRAQSRGGNTMLPA